MIALPAAPNVFTRTVINMASDVIYHQPQLPLFRSPRELRDHIYELYVLEEDGYHHGFVSSTLRRRPSSTLGPDELETISLVLVYTYKIAVNEMKSVLLSTNRVTFTTKGSWECNAGSYRGIQ